jgi:hypothetical protein
LLQDDSVCYLIDSFLVDLFCWHDEKQTLQIVGGDLVEHNFNVQPVVQPRKETKKHGIRSYTMINLISDCMNYLLGAFNV